MAKGTMVRDEVVRAATRLFTERGIRGVSLQNIADEVGLTKGALYHYFSSRDDLLRHVFGDWITQEIISLRQQTSHPGDAVEKLRAYVRYHVSSVVTNVDLYTLSFFSEVEIPHDVRAEFRGLKRQSDAILMEILRQGRAEGRFAGPDVKVAAFAIDGMCNWLCQWYDVDGPKSAADIADEFLALLVHGLVTGTNDREGDPPTSSSSLETAKQHARAIRFHSERLHDLIPRLSPGGS